MTHAAPSPFSPRPLAIDFSDIQTAVQRLAGQALLTPLIENIELNELTQGRIFLKCENLQVGGAFKFRGAYNRLAALSAEERTRGVVAASTGNHAQGVAHAARRLGLKACIVMPQDAPQVKLDNTRALGAEVIPFDRAKQDRDTLARSVAAERGAVFVHPYDDPWVMAGQGTIGIELAQQAPVPLDGVLICCGGGGLSAGIATALHQLSPQTIIYPVEPEGYDDTVKSLLRGERLGIEAGAYSICDAISTLKPGELTFPILQRYGARGLIVSDDETKEAMRFAFARLRLVVEAGGAVALAAALQQRLETKGKNIAVILSGGNVDKATYANILTE